MRRLLPLIGLMLALATPCLAGVSFIAVARSQGKATPDTAVRALVSGDKARVEFVLPDARPLPDGEYMLTLDQGKTLYMVSPRTKTYSSYAVQDMLAQMGGMVQGMRGRMKMEFESPKIEKLLEEDGGLMAGLPTRHYRYRTSYKATTHLLGSLTVTTTTEEDIWATTKLSEPGLPIWLTKAPPSTGDAQFDAIINAEMHKIEGFPLKRVTITTTVNANGEMESTHSEIEVTEVKNVDVPDSAFRIPAGYKEVPAEKQ